MKAALSLTWVLVLSAVAFADPFSGRYAIVSVEGRSGVTVGGFIEFSGAAMGTTSFNLSNAFGVTAFEIRSTAPVGPLVSNSFGDLTVNDVIAFDGPLGAAVLRPLPPAAVAGATWQVLGDLDGEADGDDFIDLGAFPVPSGLGTSWRAREDSAILDLAVRFAPDPPAWELRLVPEPGSFALAGLAIAGFLLYRRRR